MKCSETSCNRAVVMRGMCRRHYSLRRRHGQIDIRPTSAPGSKEAFLRKHINHVGDDCLIWPLDPQRPTGVVYIDGEQMTAARAMCVLAHGRPTFDGAHAAHSCGKGHLGCFSPNHLNWKTPQGNDADKDLHGTRPRGEAHGNAIFTEEQVLQIVRDPRPNAELARHLECSETAVKSIRSGITWGWLTGIQRKAA
jgi:hypothetical protein